MSIVTLVSGGLDSTLMAVLVKEEGVEQFPLFVNYGQVSFPHEWRACRLVHSNLGLPSPGIMDLSGYGKLIKSGLTSPELRVNEDAFLPGRNLLLILAGSAYACQTRSNAVAIGLLTEQFHLFPDQTEEFLAKTESLINVALYRSIKIVGPLMTLSKEDVKAIAKAKGITGTYSCHSGTDRPCGKCISCLEFGESK